MKSLFILGFFLACQTLMAQTFTLGNKTGNTRSVVFWTVSLKTGAPIASTSQSASTTSGSSQTSTSTTSSTSTTTSTSTNAWSEPVISDFATYSDIKEPVRTVESVPYTYPVYDETLYNSRSSYDSVDPSTTWVAEPISATPTDTTVAPSTYTRSY